MSTWSAGAFTSTRPSTGRQATGGTGGVSPVDETDKKLARELKQASRGVLLHVLGVTK